MRFPSAQSAMAKADLYKKTSCRYCKTPLGDPFLDLGTMPLANSFLTQEEVNKEEFVCPLRLVWCPTCRLVQLSHVSPPERMFSNYLYVSSTTQTFRKHFADYAKDAKARLQKKSSSILAVDIGSNDGLLLSCYQNEGMKAVGVEPAKNLSEEANRSGRITINDYFGASAVRKILEETGPAHIISANNVFAHIDDIHNVCQNVNSLLHPEGIFIIEFPYLVVMFEGMLFDMIYHEHLSYIAVAPLRLLLAQFGLEIFAIEQVASHGGSLRVFIQKKKGARPISKEVETLEKEEAKKGYGSERIYREFAQRVDNVRTELVSFVNQTKSQKKSLSGYGAPAKGNTLINFCGFTSSEIDYLVDDNPLKQSLFTPGARIPVVPSQYLFQHPTDYVLIFAWNFAAEIIKKLEPLREKGTQFIVPLSKPRIL